MDNSVYWCPSDGSTIQYGPVIAFDCETNARETRDPFQHVYVTAIDDGSGSAVHVLDDARRAAFMLNGVQQLGSRIVGHNASGFDRLQLKRVTGIDLKCDDTMLMAFLLHEEWGPAKQLNLEFLCMHYLNAPSWKTDVTWNWRDATTIPWDEAKQYCARDTRYTRALYLALEKELKADPLLWQLYDRLLLPASRALADMEERGLYIVDENVSEANESLIEDLTQHGDVVETIAKAHDMEKFNRRSPKQVGTLLFDKMGFPVVETTNSGARSTNANTLKTLRENFDHPIFPAMLGVRKAEKLGTYLDRFRAERDRYGMAYPWYSLVLTATGRTSGNYQQIPRDKRIRRCIGAPPGKVFIAADFGQLELRVASSKYVYDEPNMRAAFDADVDLHWLTALRGAANETIRTASLWAMQAGLPTDRTGAEVLSRLLSAAPKGTESESFLRACRALGEDTLTGRWIGQRLSEGERASEMARWFTTVLEADAQRFMRELRNYGLRDSSEGRQDDVVSDYTPQGSQPAEQRPFELADAMSALSPNRARVLETAPEWSERRSRAKQINFGYLFGAEEFTYQRLLFEEFDIVVSKADAIRDRNLFYESWPAIPAGHTRIVRELEANGQVRSFTGMLRRLPDVYSHNRSLKLAAYRQAVNAVVQTPTCHLALIGLVLLGAAGFDVRSFQHDAYLLWLDDDEATVRAATAQIRYLLETGVPAVLAAEFGIDFDVPLKVDITAGTAWTDDDRQAWVA